MPQRRIPCQRRTRPAAHSLKENGRILVRAAWDVRPWDERVRKREKRFCVVRILWVVSAYIAYTRPNLNVHRGRGQRSVAPLESKHHFVRTGTEDVFDGETPLDLTLARLVRLAVERGFRVRAVAPVPFNGRTVELFVIVGTALELRGQDDTSRRHADDRLCLQRHFRPPGFRVPVLTLFVWLLSVSCESHRQQETRRARPRKPSQVAHRKDPLGRTGWLHRL